MKDINDNPIISPLNELESFRNLIFNIEKNKTPVLTTGVIDSQKCHITYAVLAALNRPGLVITHSELHAKEIFEDLQVFLGNKAEYYPAKDLLFYFADVRSIEITKQRFKVLNSLIKNEGKTIVLSVEALLNRLTPKDIFSQFIFEYKVGDDCSIDRLTEQLVLMGYERRDKVEGAGQFAVRGGIVDLYVPLYENAVRIEFWGDTIDSVRLLDFYSQRSIEKMDAVRIFPMSELVYHKELFEEALSGIKADYEQTYSSYKSNGFTEQADNLRMKLDTALLSGNLSFRGIESFFNYFYNEGTTLFDYLHPDTLIFLDEPTRINHHINSLLEEYNESIKGRIESGNLLPGQMDMVYSYAQILAAMQPFALTLFSTLAHTFKDIHVNSNIAFDVKSAGTFRNQIDMLFEDLKYWLEMDYRVVIMAGARSRGQRLANELHEKGLKAQYYESLDSLVLKKGNICLTHGSLNKGFEYQHINLVFITGKEIFGAEKKSKAHKKKRGAKIESFTDLKVGDYVVHDNHGIGIYKGIESITRDGLSRDYLKIQYADEGNLFVHTGQMDMIQKYIGSEGANIKLNKLGGADWNKAKARTRKAVKILAKELVELYSKRQAAKGFSYSKDNIWQREFEDMFPYEETEDQVKSIDEVKADMESPRIMDRLICGDVGYGKTEVAIRAAFKAVQDGKQVAFLVPTTILAQQHYNTFCQRMKDFPINIEMMSRFRTAKQQRESLKNLETGASDIVIGTHRILSKDVKFKDLGLVIVDEEQRFGVTHKEKLKSLKTDVDVLTLTATPIPRTLHMSMTGIRDMSVLEEPPQERQPIQTYVMEYSSELVKDAINREIAREGQVYYLHNRVRNIQETAAKIQSMVPHANVAYAHGKMSEHELEYIMMDFIEGEINVLVCTTIIETGLDISNVNTIIIPEADYYGLSQLYQLRGRVGRSNRLAYAYLMYRKDKMLAENAEKRLQTIRDFTEFGSGFKIAMRDLEIRGAGNLLGGEQHGHMDVVGYDMYCKLLAEAVRELKNEAPPDDFETSIDINTDAYIPAYYIENEEQKLEIYKKISLIGSEQDYYDVQEEIEDRFGNLPNCVQRLLEIALLKHYAHRLGIITVQQKGTTIVMTFKPDADIEPEGIMEVVNRYKDRLNFAISINPSLTYRLNPKDKFPNIQELKSFLQLMTNKG